MRVMNLFEAEYSIVHGPRGSVEVMLDPSHRDVAKGINEHGELRGFYSPGDDMIGFWDANTLHEEVIGNDPVLYEYEDVLKLYVNRTEFGIYHFNNQNRTSDLVFEMMGASNDECIETLKRIRLFKILMKSREVVFES